MKKLMIALAAAATTMFSFGDDDVLPHGADFEASGYVAGENFTNYVNRAEDGVATSGNRYWYSTSEDIGVISNHQSGISVKSVPDLYENATPTGGVKYLQLDTQKPLFRTIANNDQSGSFTGVDMSTGDGVYLDTLVKFTAADAAFGTDAFDETVDKIAIEYVEREIEYGTGDEAAVVKVTPLTNFVVRAGFIGSAFATNYLVDVPDGWLENNMKDDWHRLTVRALTNIDGNNRAGFKIYLDEEPLVYRTDKDEFAQSAGFEDDTHMIFPSAVASGVNKTTISAVAFSGNGSIDDVVFTTTMPDFIKSSENVVATFTADSGVTGISVQVGSEEPIAVDMDTLTATFDPGTTEFTVTATIDGANGYVFDKMTVGSDEYTTNPANVTNYAGAAIAITTSRNNFNLFDANGAPIQGTFQTLSEAFAAEGVAMIKLAYDYDVLAVEGDEFAGYTVDGEVILDLAGNDLVGGDDSAGVSLFTATDTFTIIDSIGGGSITYDTQYTDNAIVNLTGSDAFIGAATGDAGATFNGKLFNIDFEGKIIKGSIDDASNAVAGEFLWANYVDSNSTLSDGPTAGYWVVTPKGGSEPTEIAVPTAKTDLVYDGTEKIGVVVGTGYTLTGNIATNAGNYTATATLEAGYVWSDTTTEAKSINWSIAPNADAAVVVTLTSEIEEYSAQLEFPTASAAIGGDDVAGTPAWDPATISEPEAGATNTYTVTFTVTTANYAGSTGTATFKVWKAASSGDEYPIYIDPSDTETKAKYDTWKETYGADTGSAHEDAFLLNCAPTAEAVAAAKANFKATITVNADGTVTVTAPGNYNVTPTIQGKQTLSNTEEWHPTAEGDKFFRAVLSL